MSSTNIAIAIRRNYHKQKASSSIAPANVVNVIHVNDEGQTQVANPDEVGMAGRMDDFVGALRLKEKDNNGTEKAFGPKEREWSEFCQHVYSTSEFPNHIDGEKLYKFMFYQSFRGKYKTGGKRNKKKKDQYAPKFDGKVYDKLLKYFRADSSELATTLLPIPKKPLGWPSFNQYQSCMHRMHIRQQTKGLNTIAWEFIWNNNLKVLSKLVKERAPALRKALCMEKHNAFTPYTVVTKLSEIEEHFWLGISKTTNRRCLNSRLRFRLCFLLLTSTVMRSESVFKADVSDFFSLKVPMKKKDVHQMDIQINQISHGKTTHGKLQYGRAARHKEVTRCAIGATAFYMMNREDVSAEFGSMSLANWLDNHAWFFKKFLVDASCTDTEKELTNDGYGDALREILVTLRLPTTKILHLGRNAGTKQMDCDKVDEGEVQKMGQWNQSIYDQSYSSKLPMMAIRSLAGYPKESASYCNARTTVFPSEQLLLSLPLGFSIPMLEALEEEDTDSSHTTAAHTLNWMKHLCVVFLQDAAAMSIECPDRMSCMLFKLPIFQTEAYAVS